MTSTKFWDFWTPPPSLQIGLIYSTKSVQPPLLHLLLGHLSADVICECPPKTKLSDDPQWTQLRIRALETLDTAFYSCVASNGVEEVESTAIVKVNLGKVDLGRRPSWQNSFGDDDEAGLLPETYSEPDLTGGGRVEFEGGQVWYTSYY